MSDEPTCDLEPLAGWEPLNHDTSRMAVAGGWLYRTVSGRTHVALAFVADEQAPRVGPDGMVLADQRTGLEADAVEHRPHQDPSWKEAGLRLVLLDREGHLVEILSGDPLPRGIVGTRWWTRSER